MHIVLEAAAWAAAGSSVAGSLLRLLLGVLTARAARQALAAAADGEPERLRAYRLAVLRALLGTLREARSRRS